MKKYRGTLAGLALIFALFASGVAIGMEKELPELEPQFMEGDVENLSFLPPDIRQFIVDETLHLILDEAEDNPEILLEQQWREPKDLIEIIRSLQYMQEKGSSIDMVILLIENGADPNMKNYKGNTILHLLIKDFVKRTGDFLTESKAYKALAKKTKMSDVKLQKYLYDSELNYKQYFNRLKSKIILLMKYKINLNEENRVGFTIAFPLITFAVQEKVQLSEVWAFIALLKDWGLDFNRQCNNTTACKLGQVLIYSKRLDDLIYDNYFQNQLDMLCLPKK